MNIKEASSKNVLRQLTKLRDKDFLIPQDALKSRQRYVALRTNAHEQGRRAAKRRASGQGQSAFLANELPGRLDRKGSREALDIAMHKKASMDQELAQAVFRRWNSGAPVAETTFHKAASVLGLNADDALLEARFYTALDYDLAKLASGYPLTETDLDFYSAAAGEDPRVLSKVASAYRLHRQDLIFQKLAERNWVPDLGLIKAAMMAPPMEDPSMAGGGMDAGMMVGPAGGGEQAMAPQPGQEVQQAPQQRFKPSPMAPAQVPPSDQGNLQELARSAMQPSPPSQDMMGGMGVGGPGAGTDMAPTTPAPPPPTPQEKLQQVVPDLPPETIERYAPKLEEVEQQAGMPIEDPNQIQKFVAQMKKQDQKVIDEAIKSVGESPPLSQTMRQQGGEQQAQPPAQATEKVASAARALARILHG